MFSYTKCVLYYIPIIYIYIYIYIYGIRQVLLPHPLTYHFDNGSFIEFFSADQPDKLRGARRDVLFVNECNNVVWEAYYQMAIRTREFIYLDYNPVAKFWVDTELLGDKDTDFVVLTYLDNEALDISIVKEIEKAKEKAKAKAASQKTGGSASPKQGKEVDDLLDRIANEAHNQMYAPAERTKAEKESSQTAQKAPYAVGFGFF